MSDSDKQYYFYSAEYPIMKKYPIFALRNFQYESIFVVRNSPSGRGLGGGLAERSDNNNRHL